MQNTTLVNLCQSVSRVPLIWEFHSNQQLQWDYSLNWNPHSPRVPKVLKKQRISSLIKSIFSATIGLGSCFHFLFLLVSVVCLSRSMNWQLICFDFCVAILIGQRAKMLLVISTFTDFLIKNVYSAKLNASLPSSVLIWPLSLQIGSRRSVFFILITSCGVLFSESATNFCNFGIFRYAVKVFPQNFSPETFHQGLN